MRLWGQWHSKNFLKILFAPKIDRTLPPEHSDLQKCLPSAEQLGMELDAAISELTQEEE